MPLEDFGGGILELVVIWIRLDAGKYNIWEASIAFVRPRELMTSAIGSKVSRPITEAAGR